MTVDPEQLTLADELDDGITFGEWVESLPLDPSEEPREPAPVAPIATGWLEIAA
jgi:hypothetical protein